MALQPLFFGWETDKLVFVVWQGRCPGRAQKFTVGKNEVWEALEYPGYRTVWTEKERPGSILLPLTPNCVLLSKVPHPLFYSHNTQMLTPTQVYVPQMPLLPTTFPQ